MEWKYVKELKEKNVIEEIEKEYDLEIPKYLKDLIKEYNGGRPEKRLFNTENSKEKVLQGLISFNKEDKANIIIYDDLLKKGYIPFAITEFGDIICINNKDKSVELYLHETGKTENICSDVEEFINILF